MQALSCRCLAPPPRSDRSDLQSRSCLCPTLKAGQLPGERQRLVAKFFLSKSELSETRALRRSHRFQASLQCMASTGTKTVLVPVANGTEEIEAVTIIDVLRRAGAEVTVASVEDSLTVDMSRQVRLTADASIKDCASTTFDAIALPGGMPGAETLCKSESLDKLIKDQKHSGRLLSAICAAPAVVLESKGLLDGCQATSHPGFQEKLSNQSAIHERVVEAGNIITSQAPGTAMEFSLAIIKFLYGEQKAQEVAGPMVVKA